MRKPYALQVTCKLPARTKTTINVKKLDQTRKSNKHPLIYYSVAHLSAQKIYSKGQDRTFLTLMSLILLVCDRQLVIHSL